MSDDFKKVISSIDVLMTSEGYQKERNFWKKNCPETFVGLRLSYSENSGAFTVFFGMTLKILSNTSFEDFDIGLWDSHIHGIAGVQVSGVSVSYTHLTLPTIYSV